MLILLAQVTPTDPMGGWGSLMLQGGAFGLLTYLVVVLFPRMLKEFREEREQRDANFAIAIGNLETRFEVRNNLVVVSIDKQTAQMTKALTDSSLRIEQAVAKVCRAQGGHT